MTFDPASYPDKINLGCGYDLRDGYLNIDNADHHDPDLTADVRSLEVLPSGHYREILALDVLEHLPRSDTSVALSEWFRLLAPGGWIHLQVPSAPALLGRLRETDNVDEHREVFHLLFGTQAYTGDFHLTSFSDITLIQSLAEAGFDKIELQIRDGWLFDARARRPVPGEEQSVAISWGRGAYFHEGDEHDGWRWLDQQSELLVFNTAQEPRHVSIRASVETGHRARARLRVSEPFEAKFSISNRESRVALAARLSPGAHRATIDTTASRVEAPEDPRSLYLRLLRYEVSDDVVRQKAGWRARARSVLSG